MMGRPTGCASHRTILAAFAEPGRASAQRRPRPSTTSSAVAGVEAELAETMLTIHAVRRLLDPARTADPPLDAWDRLRGRVATPAVPRAAGSRTSLAGLVVGAGLVAALIGPVAVFRTTDATEQEPGAAPAVVSARTVADQQAETAFLSRARAERTPRAEPPAGDRADGRLARAGRARSVVPPVRHRRPAGAGRLIGRGSVPNVGGGGAADPSDERSREVRRVPRRRPWGGRRQLTPPGCVRIVPAAQGPQLTVRSSVRPRSLVPAARD